MRIKIGYSPKLHLFFIRSIRPAGRKNRRQSVILLDGLIFNREDLPILCVTI